MSGNLLSWYSLPDLMAMAERGGVLEGRVALSNFGRLSPLLSSCDGSARARITFRQGHDDVLLMELQCEAALELTCQRCLQPLLYKVSEKTEFAVAETEESLSILPRGTELIALNGDRFQPAQVLEDELILSLPLVPRHGDDKHRGDN